MIAVYNSLKEHKVNIDCNLNPDIDEDFELFDNWCQENLEENGFYELDTWYGGDEDIFQGNSIDGEYSETDFLIMIEDDEKGWKKNFNVVVKKIKKFLKEK